jgi:hypothetical protein
MLNMPLLLLLFKPFFAQYFGAKGPAFLVHWAVGNPPSTSFNAPVPWCAGFGHPGNQKSLANLRSTRDSNTVSGCQTHWVNTVKPSALASRSNDSKLWVSVGLSTTGAYRPTR